MNEIFAANNSQLSLRQIALKRGFDIVGATVGLMLSFWLILLVWLVACVETRSNGFFIQKRVGMNGKIFHLIKIKTMFQSQSKSTTVTCSGDPRITFSGTFFRKTKIDELPQLWNVLIGDMSFVGPRPDVPGFADLLTGEDRLILSIRPGITGPATLQYRNEEELLANVESPEEYNSEIIFPDKVRLNKKYIKNYSLMGDIKYIVKTFVG